MQDYRHSIYLSASWSSSHDLNLYVTRRLIDDYGLLVVGDHKAYVNTPHERGLNYRARVEEILGDCSGMVALFPHKQWPQTTSSYMFLELLLAVRHGLPVLLLCETGVEVEWRTDGGEVLLVFGATGVASPRTISIKDVASKDFRVSTLQSVHAIKLPQSTSILNQPVFLPRVPGPENVPASMPTLIEEFVSGFQSPQRRDSVFNIMPYAKEHERAVVAKAVFEETGLTCVNGSDVWAGAPFTRGEIIDQIRGARFVIADLSDNSRACIYEAGVAVGAGKEAFAVTRTPEMKLPFGPDQLHLISYQTDLELDRAVRSHCRPYRRRVFNVELAALPEWRPAAARGASSARLIILLHGIRTQATWQEMVRSVLGGNNDTEIVPVKYGFLDALRFWFPIWTRRKPIQTARWKTENAIARRPGTQVIIIAHSFGTYILARLLAEVPSIRPNKVLLCGSIVRTDFRWDRIDPCPEIINDCGSRDVWPVLATAFSWGYGPSGTFGFGMASVRDRFHDFRHSDYFDREFVERFWKPWVEEDTLIASTYETEDRRVPYWMSVLTVPLIRIVLLLAVSVVAGLALLT